MKKASNLRKTRKSSTELRREYRFDYRRARRNRFASQLHTDAVAVILEPDVAAVFRSSDSVNTLLRSVLSALPDKSRD
jgi:hypothetical protein